MATVVVVTRNPALALGLRHHGYEVYDVRPDRYGDWMADARTADAAMLELSDPVAAEAAVQRLRSAGLALPVLLVSNNSPGWETVADHIGSATKVLPLPISLPALMAALDALIAAGPMELPPPPANEDELLSAVAASIGMAISDSGTLVADDSPPTMPRVRVVEAEPEPSEPEPVAEDPPPTPPGPPEPAPPPPRVELPPRTAGVDALVTALASYAHELSSVADCAEVAVDELADRVGAEATACLLPDGDEWRVAGGRGLRPLEHRLRLTSDHWLVRHVLGDDNALTTDDTDGLRESLHGAPLASWKRLLAVPVPEVHGLLVAARAERPFDEASVTAAAEVASEAAPLLVEAVAARDLARKLLPYADLDE